MVCNNCDGRGKSHFDRTKSCPKCFGNGVIEKPEPVICKCSKKHLLAQKGYPAWFLCDNHGIVKRGKNLLNYITVK